MNKKIILGLLTATLLATSSLANSHNKQQNCANDATKSCKMQQNNKHKESHMFAGMFMRLDLTDKQRAQVSSIISETMKSIPNPHDAFTENSFDKKKFMKLAREKREAKIELRAEMIEKVYNVLDDSQRKDLKTMLNMKDMMQKNNMKKGKNCNAKNCNGGR